MKFNRLPIVSAAFLIVAMTIQFVMSYHREKVELEERIQYKMELAQKDFFFEVYDMHEATNEIRHFYSEFDTDSTELYALLETVLWHYPELYSCYLVFLPERSPEPGRWFVPCAFRVNEDSILVYNVGNNVDYPNRDWYTGALKSGDEGHWSLPYNDGDHADPVFTHSQKVYDDKGQLAGVAGADFTLAWTRRILDDSMPYDDAVCRLYSSEGTLIVEIGSASDKREMIMYERVLSPTNMRLVIGVPEYHIRDDIAWTSLITLAVLLSGILILGLLLRQIGRERDAFTRIDTANKVMEKELQIASTIQMGILHEGLRSRVKGEPWPDVELQAALVPMREVGGDLYDFYRKDDDLYFVIGDVSGKSVTAAMLMSATVNLFRSAVKRLQSPKDIMEEMNAVLSGNNPSLMFVTAFIGRLHIPTGELMYCNAGHLPPLMVNSQIHPVAQTCGTPVQSAVRALDIKPNIPLGYDGNFKYAEQGTMLGEGGMIVLYTDGLTEARNEKREMLGMQRWMEIVKNNIRALADGDMLAISEAGMQFTGNAEQADDMTLMAITKTSRVQPLQLHVESKLDQWPALRTRLHSYGSCAGMDARALKKMVLAIEEMVVNIIKYSEADWMEMTLNVTERISSGGKELTITLRDNGGMFDPTRQAEVDTDALTADRQVGGLGIALVRQIADDLSYNRKNGINELTIIKAI